MTTKKTAGKQTTKRISKAAIYAEFGIEYKAGKILAPLYGFINPLLINGNKKLGKGVYTFSTLPTNESISYYDESGKLVSEKGTCPCKCDHCYACGGCYTFNSTKASLARKTVLCRLYLDFVKRAIMAQIKADKINICRIHAAGDFFSSDYIEMWKDICRENPSCLFWSYTKNPLAETAFNDIANCNIVKSVIPGKGFNFGECGYIITLYSYLKSIGKTVYICRCGIDKEQHCTNCHHCAESDFVLFLKHGDPAYNPEKDPLFPAFKAIVDSQIEDSTKNPLAAD